MKRIAIIGASGLVGATLTERLIERGADEVVPFIHSSGNAMRLARRGLALRMLDLQDEKQVHRALEGITHVVNCSRGGDDIMLGGLANLLAASSAHRVRRFVHLSSVAVYGDPPPAESVHENAPTLPERGTYGWTKLEQDRMVAQAATGGLPSIVLCPPNISGPYSYYLVSLVDALAAGRFALLEDGCAPCNLVDVTNLCHAIELALDRGPVDGARLFVTDDDETSWRDVIGKLSPLAGSGQAVPQVSRGAMASGAVEAAPRPPGSLLGSLKHLVSSDVRAALRKDPLWEKADVAMRRLVARAGSSIEDRVRLSVEGPLKVEKLVPRPRWSTPLARQQLRGVRHSCELAKQALGYRPLYDFDESMKAFGKWYRAHRGMDSETWPLLEQLQ